VQLICFNNVVAHHAKQTITALINITREWHASFIVAHTEVSFSWSSNVAEKLGSSSANDLNLFNFAIFRNTMYACSILPVASSHRGDSSTNLQQ